MGDISPEWLWQPTEAWAHLKGATSKENLGCKNQEPMEEILYHLSSSIYDWAYIVIIQIALVTQMPNNLWRQ